MTERSVAESRPSATSQPAPEGARGVSDVTTEQKIIKNKVGLLAPLCAHLPTHDVPTCQVIVRLRPEPEVRVPARGALRDSMNWSDAAPMFRQATS